MPTEEHPPLRKQTSNHNAAMNHRMGEVRRDLWRSSCPTPAQAEPPKVSLPGTCPVRGVSPKMVTLPPVRTTYARRVSKLVKHHSSLVDLC